MQAQPSDSPFLWNIMLRKMIQTLVRRGAGKRSPLVGSKPRNCTLSSRLGGRRLIVNVEGTLQNKENKAKEAGTHACENPRFRAAPHSIFSSGAYRATAPNTAFPSRTGVPGKLAFLTDPLGKRWSGSEISIRNE